jgi:magnesium-transporting ATPase (P-type)
MYIAGTYDSDYLSIEFYIVTFLVSVCTNLLLHLYFYRIIRILEKETRNDKLLRLNKYHKWVVTSISSLKVGDIVRLSPQNVCPADILVLDSTEQRMNGKIVMVNERKITGVNNVTRKWPISDKLFPGIEQYAKEIKSVLHGSVEYLDPAESVSEVIGSFKIKGDPKAKSITLDNILFTGSKLHSSGVLGMVLYTGRDTRIYKLNLKNQQLFGTRQHIASPASKYISFVTIFMSIISVLGATLLFLWDKNYDRIAIQQINIVEGRDSTNHFLRYIEILSICGSIIPLALSILKDLSNFIKGYLIQRRTNSILESKTKMNLVSPSVENFLAKQKSLRSVTHSVELPELTPISERFPVNLVGEEPPTRSRFRRGVTGVTRDRTKRFTNLRGLNIGDLQQGSGAEAASELDRKNSVNPSGKEPIQKEGNTTPNAASENKPAETAQKVAESQAANKLSYSPMTFVQISNYPSLSVLGRIDHVFFDKTETLTESNLEVVYLSTWKRTYEVDSDKTNVVYEEFMKNPEAHKCQDIEEESQDFEDGFYSEKSQEFEDELLGNYNEHLFEINPKFTEEIDKIKMPYYMPVPVDYVVNESMRADRSSPMRGNITEADDGFSCITSNRVIKVNSKVEEIIFSKGKLQQADVERLEHLLLHIKKPNATTILPQMSGDLKTSRSSSGSEESFDSDEPQQITSNCLPINTFHSFFYDNHSKSPEMQRMISTLVAFLFCGMDEMKKTYTPSILNNAIAKLLKGVGVEVYFPSDKNLQQRSAGSFINTEFGHALRVETMFGMVDHLQIYGVNPKNSSKPRTSIVLAKKNTTTPQYFLLVRGEQSAMKSIMKMTDEELTSYRNLMAQYKDKRTSRYIFAYKRLTREEVVGYVAQYSQIIKAKKYEVDSINRVAIPLEQNLRFLGSIGVKAKIRKEAFQLMDNLKSAYLKISILSGDDFENTINVTRELGLPPNNLSDLTSYFNINFDSTLRAKPDMIAYIEIIYHMLKSYNYFALNFCLSDTTKEKNKEDAHQILSDLTTLSSEKKRIDNKFKRPMVLSGKAFSLIQSEENLLQYFKILLVFTSSVIGHDLSPNQKSQVVKMIRIECEEIVLSVGDGLNDMGMFNESNVSIQLANDDIPTLQGDLIINKLDIISDLLFSTGFNMFKNLKSVCFMFTLVSVKFAALNAWTFGLNGFSAKLFDTYTVQLFLILLFVQFVFTTALHKPYPNSFMAMNLAAYHEHQIFSARVTLMSSLFFLSVIVELGLIVIISRFFYSQEIYREGMMGGQNEVTFFTLTTMVFNSLFLDYLFWMTSQQIKVVFLGAYIIFFVILMNYHFSVHISDTPEYFVPTVAFSNSIKVSCYLFCFLVPTYFNYIFIAVVKARVLNPVSGVLSQYPSKYKEWKDHVEDTDPIVVPYIKKYIEYNHTPEKLMDRVIRVVRPQLSKTVEPILLKLLLLNVHNFNLGFDHVRNKIIDMRDHLKFIVANSNNHDKFTRMIFILEIIFYSIELSLKVVWISSSNDQKWAILYRQNMIYMIALYGCVLAYIWKRKPKDESLYRIVLSSQIVAFVISCILLLIEILMPTDTLSSNFFPLGINTRLVSSSIPLDFTQSLCLLIGFQGINIYRLIWGHGPVGISISNKYYIAIIVANLVTIAVFLISMKKKYDKNIKINFLSVNRMKTEIGKTRDKLSMLMPKFVWDKINTEGYSSNLLLLT